jgi:DNA-binding Lrp family transcriptional regulator
MKPLFVQIKCDLGAAFGVARAIIDTVEEASELYSTSGEYDLLAKFYLAEDQSPGRFVVETLQRIAGIRDTYTLIAYRIFGQEQNERLAGDGAPGL